MTLFYFRFAPTSTSNILKFLFYETLFTIANKVNNSLSFPSHSLSTRSSDSSILSILEHLWVKEPVQSWLQDCKSIQTDTRNTNSPLEMHASCMQPDASCMHPACSLLHHACSMLQPASSCIRSYSQRVRQSAQPFLDLDVQGVDALHTAPGMCTCIFNGVGYT